MNTLIKKIAIESGAFTEIGSNVVPGDLILTGNHIETFAKQIVEHCCFLCTYPDLDDEQSYYADLFASLLRDKFNLNMTLQNNEN